ncbi:MAG: TrkA C-terminal domain-containing protein [Fidelibacterota bacterium]|nr:MAG: TrkA C-terminal domain-containing protein [Candidatus Neomarinimicrobiota bacterium]
MIAIFTLLLIVTLSITIMRIATIALVHTGLSSESARFQARSAFTGSGFTTSESEQVVNHPVRRRIVMTLMLLGNAGIVTVISSLILTFVAPGGTQSALVKAIILILGLIMLWFASRSRWIYRRLSRLIDRLLTRYTHLDTRDYASLMHLAGDYSLVEMEVEIGDWIEAKTLEESEVGDEGIIVLGIKRADGTYLGAPRGSTKVCAGDILMIYGRVGPIELLDQRRKDRRGDREHLQAIQEQKQVVEEEMMEDPETKTNTRES